MKKIEKLSSDRQDADYVVCQKINEIIHHLNQDCPVDSVVDYKPKVQYWYWCLDNRGDKGSSTWTNDRIDNHRLLTGNCFTVEADCDRYLAYVNALKAIIEFKLKNGLTWKADWSNNRHVKWYINVNKEKEISIFSTYSGNDLNLLGYYRTREDAQKVAENCRAEVLIVAAY